MNARAPAPRQRLPAFGRELLELRRRGLVPDPPEVFVSLDSWKWAPRRTRVVVAPDVESVELDFSFVAGLDVWMGWWPGTTVITRRDTTIRAILAALPQRLIVVAYEDPVCFIWIKSTQVGIELAEFR